MRIKLHYLFILFTVQFGFSQTEKIIQGTVVFENFVIPNVEIINSTSKKVTLSDASGNFLIATRPNDTLVFVSKSYELKKVKITKSTFEKGKLIVVLILKAEELAEVIITNEPSIKLSNDKKWEQQKLDEYKLERTPKGAQSVNFNDSPIPNGPDFGRIVGMITSLFGKEKEKPKEILPEINFKTLAEALVDQQYFLTVLQLKEDEIDLFLQFCEADPKSYQVVKDNNVLAMMDFLQIKNEAFKKL